MLLFGHLGITLGSTLALQGIMIKCSKSNNSIYLSQKGSSNNRLAYRRKKLSLVTVIETLSNNIDIRFLLIGAILPDIIDKPLGILHLGDGRAISHTMLFLLIFTLIGWYLYLIRKWKVILVLSASIFFHLILDEIWLNPYTFFWPFNGWYFPAGNPSDWLSFWVTELTTDKLILISEVIGFSIIIYFIYFLLRQRKLIRFIKTGYVDVTIIKE